VNVHAKNKAGSTALEIALGLEMFRTARCLEEHVKGCLGRDGNGCLKKRKSEENEVVKEPYNYENGALCLAWMLSLDEVDDGFAGMMALHFAPLRQGRTSNDGVFGRAFSLPIFLCLIVVNRRLYSYQGYDALA
jgi:hypothetical protein